MTENTLLSKLKNGEEKAYEVLFKTFYKELVMQANRYLYDLDSSREIVQALFVYFYEKRKTLFINTSLKSYLYSSVQNRCLNYINSQKTKQKYVEHIKNTNNMGESIIEKEIELVDLENRLYESIGQLPPKCRMIFKMNRFDGLSNSEIAERLSLSKRTVETQISKALKILREKLQPFLSHTIVLLNLLFFWM